MTPRPSLESLPPEIQLIVLKHLSTNDHSLRAFACVSRICHNLASPLIYHTIKIGVDSENIHFTNLHQWAQSSQGRTRLQLVRCLAIYNTRESRGPPHLSYTDSDTTRIRPVFISEKPRARHGRLQLYKELENNAEPSARSPPRPSSDVWLRLADLILQLPGLMDLFFFLPTEFPECLLDRIHRFRPECRLHIDGIVLRNLATASIDSYEFRLASSPCLYSIRAIDHTDANSNTDKSSSYYQDIVPLMASGLAPNLKEVTLVYHYFWPATLDPFILPQWKGFDENTVKHYSKSRGSLEFLRLKNGWEISEDMLDNWSARTDFTKLKTLELDTCLTSERLRYIATKFHFPCLTTLVLGRIPHGNLDIEVRHERQGIDELLSSLPSLESLTLNGWRPVHSIESLAIILAPSLLELKLLNYRSEDLTTDDLKALGRHCQLLQNFTLSLRRSQGNAKEARLYKALGSAPNLQFITLDLHVDNKFESWDIIDDEDGNVWNRTFDDKFDRTVPPETVKESETCNGAMREQLINCAIDAKLARSIFDTISAGKPQKSLPLQELNIQIIGAGDFGRVGCSKQYNSVIHHICHSWRITRIIGSDRCHEIQKTQAVPDSFQPPPEVLESYLEAIWRRIWPEKISEDWRSDWRSLPISEVT